LKVQIIEYKMTQIKKKVKLKIVGGCTASSRRSRRAQGRGGGGHGSLQHISIC
jgi:hypothetical protein